MANAKQDEINIRIREVVDLPGKKVAITIPATYTHADGLQRPQRIVADFRCLEQEQQIVCQICTLRFRCYLSDTLEIDYKDLALPDEAPINDKVKAYIAAHQITTGEE